MERLVGNPFRLVPEDEAYREPLEKGLLDELYSRSLTAVVALLVALPFLRPVLGSAWDESAALRGAVAVLGIAVLFRLVLLVAGGWLERLWPGPAGRRGLFVVGSTLVAGGFAVINVTAVPRLDDGHVALLAICEAGFNSVAVVSMAGSPAAFLSYLVLSLASLAAAVLARGPAPFDQTLAGLIALYVLALAALSVHLHLALRRGILLGLRLGDLASRDGLTGLQNRRVLEERMEDEARRVVASWTPPPGRRRPGAPESLGVLVVDLDHFKSLNDRSGHAAGDAALRQIASVLRAAVRLPDPVARWGGEEFVVVVPDPDRVSVGAVAERIRRALAGADIVLPSGERHRQTCSVGYALFPFSPLSPGALSWRDVLDLADKALRTAKARGRNRSVGIASGAAFEADPRAAKRHAEEDLGSAVAAGLVEVGEGDLYAAATSPTVVGTQP